MSEQKISKINHDEAHGVNGSSLDDEPAIFKLNDDCLTQIFAFLPIPERIRIQRVCKRWQKTSTLPWHDMKTLDIGGKCFGFLNNSVKPSVFNTLVLEQLLSLCGTCLTHIKLSAVESLTIKQLLVLVNKMCPNIQSIDCQRLYSLSCHVVQYLIENFNDIRHLTIGPCAKASKNILSTYFSDNRRLKSFSLCGSDNMTGKCVHSLPADCIEYIKIRGCKHFSTENLNDVLKKLSSHINEILASAPSQSNLRTLVIETTDRRVRYAKLVHVYVPNICKLAGLHTLQLSGEYILHDETLINVGKHCKDLRHVTLGYSNRVKDAGLQSITRLPKLEYLELSYLEKITYKAFTDMPVLKSLKCVSCGSLEFRVFDSLIQVSENLERMEIKECRQVRNENLINIALRAVKNRPTNKLLQIYLEDKKQAPSRQVLKFSYSLHVIIEKYVSWYDQ